MYKLILVFHASEDLESFEERWSRELVPQVERMPGLKRVAVSRVEGSPTEDSDVHLLHELYFEDRKSLERAMASPEGQRAGRLLMDIAGSGVELLFAQYLEDRPRPNPASR